MTADTGPPGQHRPADPAAALAERLFQDVTGALELFTVYLGDRLGLYRALHTGGPATSAELAARTGTAERYIREWLEHHAASGLLEVDDPAAGPLARRYRLPPMRPGRPGRRPLPGVQRRRGRPRRAVAAAAGGGVPHRGRAAPAALGPGGRPPGP